MSSTKEYRDFIIEKSGLAGSITTRQMMGEFLLYYKGNLFGGIYDNRLLVKKTETNKKYNMKDSVPYPGAKAMYLVDEVDDTDKLSEIIISTYESIK